MTFVRVPNSCIRVANSFILSLLFPFNFLPKGNAANLKTNVQNKEIVGRYPTLYRCTFHVRYVPIPNPNFTKNNRDIESICYT